MILFPINLWQKAGEALRGVPAGSCKRLRNGLLLALLFFASFAAGGFAARFAAGRPVWSPFRPDTENWGLGFSEEGKTPTGNASIEELARYDAWYAQDTEEKVLYLTFDAGYENGNTPAILDALKKHSAPAAFFVVGNFLSTSPDLVRRMAEEGHLVCNHTYHHPDMSKISDKESFSKELSDVEELYQQITGREMVHFYRPPQGKYSVENLQMAKELGYQTFFWSLAYVDWYQDDQPTKEEAFEKLLGRIHPGAIVLLHSTSSTNAAILDELLTRYEEMGYSFRSLTQLVSSREEEKSGHPTAALIRR